MKRRQQSDIEIATKMIERGARPPIVSATVGISKETVRALWRDITGKRPPQGLCPYNCLTKLATHNAATHGNLFFLVYARRGDEVMRTADPEEIIAAYDSYEQNMVEAGHKAEIDFTTAWYIARDLRSLFLEVRYCRTCRLHYIYHADTPTLSDCPYCRMASIIERKRAN
jgi:flagellar transcriptional activator FlhC